MRHRFVWGLETADPHLFVEWLYFLRHWLDFVWRLYRADYWCICLALLQSWKEKEAEAAVDFGCCTWTLRLAVYEGWVMTVMYKLNFHRIEGAAPVELWELYIVNVFLYTYKPPLGKTIPEMQYLWAVLLWISRSLAVVSVFQRSVPEYCCTDWWHHQPKSVHLQ